MAGIDTYMFMYVLVVLHITGRCGLQMGGSKDVFRGGHVERSNNGHIRILRIMLPVDQIFLFSSAMNKT